MNAEVKGARGGVTYRMFGHGDHARVLRLRCMMVTVK